MKDTLSSCLVSKARLLKGGCMKGLKALQSNFKIVLDDLKDFGRVATFKRTFFQDMDLLEKHLTKEILHEIDCKNALTKLRTIELVKEISLDSKTKDVHAIKYKISKAKERCMAYFRSLHSHFQVLSKEDLIGTRIKHGFKRAFLSFFGPDDDIFTKKYFVEYTGIEVKHFKDTLLQHLGNVKKFVTERTRHQKQYDRKVKKRQMQMQESKVDTGKALDASLVVTVSSGTESEVQDEGSRSENDTDANDADIRPIYDQELMAEVQLPAEFKSPLLDPLPEKQATELLNQSIESENICLKQTVAQFQKDFLRMEAHYVTETINIELENSVAKLLIENEHLNKENEYLKKTYKDLYDSIKKTRVQTKDHNDSLTAQLNKKSIENADLKAQIQKKVFAIAALKNKLRKLKGNIVDTKFAKPSILGKPTLQPLRNQ
ncbi:hypothetical protein Tco_0307449 [Tanacetum coccineum]